MTNVRALFVAFAVLTAGRGRWTSAPAADGARVLAVETVAAKSRWNFMSGVLRSLTDAGHVVTVFTPFPDGDRENYTEVDTSAVHRARVDMDLPWLLAAFGRPLRMIDRTHAINRALCDTVHGDRRLFARADRFDVIVAEPLGHHCMSCLAAALRLPLVYAVPSPTTSHDGFAFTGHPAHPAVVPHLLARHAAPDTFARRLVNGVLHAYDLLATECRERYARLADPRPYDSCPTVGPSVVFQNSHYVTETSGPVAANVIHVGGIHLRKPAAETVPRDVLDFIEHSPHGVIYFTFGSTVNMSTLPERVETAFKRALARVPQNVLWRYDGRMEDRPTNVMTGKWFPQLHPKTRLFISHGGVSGVYETVDAGVPVLGFPLIYDQPRNIEHLVHNGMAISMDLLSVTEDGLLNAISELVDDPKYAANAKIASARFKDRPMSPERSVVYWTEYVIRHHGAPHLKSAAVETSWFRYLLLDVIAVMSIVVSVAVCVVCGVFRFVGREFGSLWYSNRYARFEVRFDNPAVRFPGQATTN